MTGKITQILKGSLDVGSAWNSKFGIRFNQGSDIKRWQDFFKLKSFKTISFLKNSSGNHYQTTGAAEETAGCKTNPQFSFCDGYDDYKKNVQACLNTQTP